MSFDFSLQSIAATILVGLGTYGVIRYFRKRESIDSKIANWSPLEAVGITIAIYFISQIIVAVVIGAYGELRGIGAEELTQQIENSSFVQFLYILGIECLTVAFLYVFMKHRKTSWSVIGWVKPRISDIGYALGGFGVYFLVYGVLLTTLISNYLPIDTEQRQELGFDVATTGPELIFIFLSLVILPPLIEEIIVRGFLFTGLRTKLPFITAAIVTSIVFGAAHLQWGSDAPLLWTAAIDTFTLSMILVYLRHKTSSLWPGIGLHFIKNGIAFFVLFVLKVT